VQKNRRQKYKYPGIAEDKLFLTKYRHQHRESTACVCDGPNGVLEYFDPVCDDAINSTCEDLGRNYTFLSVRERAMQRQLLDPTNLEQLQKPIIHIGSIASADTVMISPSV
jgi:hypothetical protein